MDPLAIKIRPEIVCLCDSTRFKQEFADANRELTLQGKIVLTVGFYGHQDDKPLDQEVKDRLDVLHFKKIDLADRVYVVNPNGYIGFSTKREIAYTFSLYKDVNFLDEARGKSFIAEYDEDLRALADSVHEMLRK